MALSLIIGWIFDFVALTLVATLLYLVLRSKGKSVPTLAIVAILAAFFALMGNPDRFESMSFSPTTGIQTKARQAIQQAQVTIDQLQKLAVALTEASLNTLALSGQVFVGTDTAERFRIHDQIVERLDSIGVQQSDLLKAQRMWIAINCSMLEGEIEGIIAKSLPNINLEQEVDKIAETDGRSGLPSPKALRLYVLTKNLNDPKLRELIQEYESVWNTGSMRNPNLIPFGSVPKALGLMELPASPRASGGLWNNGGVPANAIPLLSGQQSTMPP